MGLDLSSVPAWLLDDEAGRIPWANLAAVRLFNAADRDALFARDFSDFSPASRARMAQQRLDLRAGRPVQTTWTMYPQGQPKTVLLHISLFELDDGRSIFFGEGFIQPHAETPSDLRAIEALRHTEAMVALVNPAGEILMANPAASRAFLDAPLANWFVDERVAAAVKAAPEQSEIYCSTAQARTTAGERWHLVQARKILDPVSGRSVSLVEQLDITAQKEQERTIARQRDEILALSAPLLRLGAQILALPIIGTLDAERAARILDDVLGAVTQQRIRHVIIDLTGAGNFDSASVRFLVHLARALLLLGARPLLCGISPGLARALTEMQSELTSTVIVRDLGEALAACGPILPTSARQAGSAVRERAAR